MVVPYKKTSIIIPNRNQILLAVEPEKLETIRVQPVASFHFQPDITGETGEFDLDLDLDFDLDWDLQQDQKPHVSVA